MDVGVGAVALSGGVVTIHSPVKVLMLGDPDVGWEDLNGQRAVGSLLRVGVQLCCTGVARGRHGDSLLTCKANREQCHETGIISEIRFVSTIVMANIGLSQYSFS